MIRFSAVLSLIALPALGDQICDDISALNAGLSDKMRLSGVEVACGQGIAIGNLPFRHCAWPYEFRAPEATSAFETASRALEACDLITRRSFEDQIVNHPDSYDLHIFDLPEAEVSLSLKDKGALQQTYVFLRVQTR